MCWPLPWRGNMNFDMCFEYLSQELPVPTAGLYCSHSLNLERKLETCGGQKSGGLECLHHILHSALPSQIHRAVEERQRWHLVYPQAVMGDRIDVQAQTSGTLGSGIFWTSLDAHEDGRKIGDENVGGGIHGLGGKGLRKSTTHLVWPKNFCLHLFIGLCVGWLVFLKLKWHDSHFFS